MKQQARKQYTDPGLLEIVTLENAIYMGVKNDLAFLVDFHLYLYEHQSTVNLNMPFRFLQYVTEEYGRFTAEENVYGGRRVPLPTPHFIVFYNGRSPYPERQVMKLSDAFREQESEPQLELRVMVLNINEGYNAELKRQCRTLDEYMKYVDRVREYAASMPMREAVDRAVDECIDEGILRDFLLAHKAEGIEKGIEAFILDNIESGFTKKEIILKLMKRFGINEAKAEAYYGEANAKNQ